MVVRQRQIDGLIETDQRRILANCCPCQQREKHCRYGEHQKEPWTHKVQIKVRQLVGKARLIPILKILKHLPSSGLGTALLAFGNATCPEDIVN